MITLRPDQAELKAGIKAEYAKGAQNVLGVLPTGGGKSVIVSDIVLENHIAGAIELVGAHRNELVGQMSLHIARRGIRHRIFASKPMVAEITAQHRAEFQGRSFVDPSSNCVVGSVDTILARKDQLGEWCKQVDYVTMDEGHHTLRENKWGELFGLFQNARGLLVTASPTRADGKGLGRHADGICDSMVLGPDMRTLINMGALSDYEIACPESDLIVDDADFAPSGDLSPKRGREASKRSHIVGDCVREYVSRAYGKRFICFATDVETAGEIAGKFLAVGIPVAAVSAKTPAAVRNDYIRRFRAGQLMGLINVDLFGEGFDVPAVEVVIMARPTASLAVYLQQFGRALRVLAGKPYGLVIDHVSNWHRHGLPDKPHYWTLDRRERGVKRERDPEEIELTACRGCSRPYLRCLPACPYCGWSPPLPEPGGRSIDVVEGDLTLLDRERLAIMRAAMMLESPSSVGERVGAVAGPIAALGATNKQVQKFSAQQRLADAIAQWAGWQRYKGRSDAEAYRRFYFATGVDVASALALNDRAKYDELAAKVEGWCTL